ncbi:MAG: KH domain-containing protein [Chloroflexi bacterium]|uniref:RNA-binding protein KhpA n=1 Tax=Candidatus Chlorohelix allophototropha TaxID=3003348 RepID=A0A8T7M5G9_9CHLR|nr:KH domain-containing protein [Chloroflexota bacterium]WJW69262.1 KH domain-containing protein [Chloroflexota bacterium L227-S17]
MKDLILYVAQSLVDNPQEVHVRQIDSSRSIIIKLSVAPEDMGKVIGKQGKIAKSLRTLLSVAAAREGKRATLEIQS